MLKQVVSAHVFMLFACDSLSVKAIPQISQESAQSANDQDIRQAELSPLTQLGTKYQRVLP
jgi:hypothetical protein